MTRDPPLMRHHIVAAWKFAQRELHEALNAGMPAATVARYAAAVAALADAEKFTRDPIDAELNAIGR